METTPEVKKVLFKDTPKTKMVCITTAKDGSMQLDKYVGGKKKSEAQLEIEEETTLDGLKSVIEEFRAM